MRLAVSRRGRDPRDGGPPVPALPGDAGSLPDRPGGTALPGGRHRPGGDPAGEARPAPLPPPPPRTIAAEVAPQYLAPGEWDGLVPVPLYWARRWRRGFNQAEVLARAVGRRHGLPVLPRALRRVRATPLQHGDFAARRKNVRDAFAARQEVAGRRLLLVDDVFTTGATADACAATLLRAGAADVGVLTLARVE